jgi:hypothetical protein
MAEAYSGDDRTSYRYQYSALPGLHGQDTGAYFGPLGSVPYLSTDYQRAFMRMCIIIPTNISSLTYRRDLGQLRYSFGSIHFK